MDTTVGLEVIAALGGGGGGLMAMDYVARERRLGAAATVWRLVLPADLEAGSVERLVLSLHGTLRSRLRRLLEGQPWFSVELVASPEMVELQVWVPAAAGPDLVRAQVEAALPGVQLVAGDALTSGRWAPGLAGAWLVGRGEGLLRTDTPTPGLAAVLAGLGNLGAEERAVVQLVVEPRSPGVQARLLGRADDLLHGKRRDGTRVQPSVAERARASRLQAKAARPLYSVSVRLLAAAPVAAQAERRVSIIAAGWHQFTTAEMHFTRRRPLSLPRLVRAVRDRVRVRVPAPTLLNSGELAAVLAVTPEVARTHRLSISATRRLEAPRAVPERGIVLGLAPTRGGERPAAVNLGELARHAHVIGPTGVGKSTLLAQIAVQAIEQGASVVVLDGKDELADLILPRLPADRVDDVAVLDLADREHVWALNPLQRRSGDAAEVIADDVLTPIRALFSASWGQRTEHWLRTLLITMLSQPGDVTILDAVIALHDDDTLHHLASNTTDPVLQAAWRGFFAQSPAARAEILAPLRNKLASLVMGGLRGMLGAPSTINLDEAINTGTVLMPRFSKARLGEDTARLGASLFMTIIWQATRRRIAIPPHRRNRVLIICDEFQDFVHLPTDFEAVLSQARSLGVGLVLAHQELHQLPTGMRHAILANARTRVVYPVGAEDARVLAHELEPHLTAEHLRALPAYEIAAVVSAGGHTTTPFTIRTLPLAPGDPTRAEHAVRSSRNRYTTPRRRAEAALRRRLHHLDPKGAQPAARYGRRPVTNRMTDRSHEHPAQPAQPGGTSPESDRDTYGTPR